jgi:hypothetical protein
MIHVELPLTVNHIFWGTDDPKEMGFKVIIRTFPKRLRAGNKQIGFMNPYHNGKYS